MMASFNFKASFSADKAARAVYTLAVLIELRFVSSAVLLNVDIAFTHRS